MTPPPRYLVRSFADVSSDTHSATSSIYSTFDSTSHRFCDPLSFTFATTHRARRTRGRRTKDGACVRLSRVRGTRGSFQYGMSFCRVGIVTPAVLRSSGLGVRERRRWARRASVTEAGGQQLTITAASGRQEFAAETKWSCLDAGPARCDELERLWDFATVGTKSSS